MERMWHQTVVSELTNRIMWSSDLMLKDKEGSIKTGSTKETAVKIGRVVTMQRSSCATKQTRLSVSMYREMKNWFFSDK